MQGAQDFGFHALRRKALMPPDCRQLWGVGGRLGEHICEGGAYGHQCPAGCGYMHLFRCILGGQGERQELVVIKGAWGNGESWGFFLFCLWTCVLFRPSSRVMCFLGFEGKTSDSGEGAFWENGWEVHGESECRTGEECICDVVFKLPLVN